MNEPQRLLDAPAATSDLLRAALDSARLDSPAPQDLTRLSDSLAQALPAGALALHGTAVTRFVSLKVGAGALAAAALVGVAAYAVVAARPGAPAVSGIAHSATVPSAHAPLPVTSEVGTAASAGPVPAATESATPGVGTRTPGPMPAASREPTEPEPAMLERAHDALVRGAPTRALALAQDHARAYPSGALAQEREVIAVQALLALGRTEAARARVQAFRARYPGSSHLARLDALVGP